MSDGFASVFIGPLLTTGTDEFGVTWWTEQIDGWPGSPGSSLTTTQKSGAPGAFGSPVQLTPRTIAPGGKFQAPSIAAARDAIDRLNEAVSLSSALVTVTEFSGLTRWCAAMRQDEVLQDYLTDTLVQWSAQMTCLDPRKLSASVQASTGLPSVTGGLTIPFTIPFTIDATVVSGRCSLTNLGNYPGPVTMAIEGPDSGAPLVGPSVTHIESGLTLAFPSSLQIGPGEWLEINMDARQALANGQSVRPPSVRGWSPFLPGVNQWAFTAVSGSGLLTVTGTPAWL